MRDTVFDDLKNKAMKLAVFSVITACNFASAHQVISIADGDTLSLLVDSKSVKIRLANIDAPELGQPFGRRSRQSLSQLCWGKEANFERQSTDRYGRIVAVVICGDQNASVVQVERGLAWVYPKYNKDPRLLSIQNEAMKNDLGLWYELDPIAPWDFRKLKYQHK